MTAHHTPAPWRFDPATSSIAHDSDGPDCGFGVAEVMIPSTPHFKSSDTAREQEANGYLLAAAPEMFAVLEVLESRFRFDDPMDEIADEIADVIATVLTVARGWRVDP